METLTTVLGALLGLATVVATGFAALQQGTVKTLRETNGDLRAQNSDLKDMRTEHESRIARLEQDRETLANVITGEAHLTKIEGLLDEQSEQLEQHHVDQKTQLENHHRDAMRAFQELTEALRRRN